MIPRPPAVPGMPVEQIDTPALIVDLDPFERNLDAMAGFAAQAGLSLRPHAKAHKSPPVALAQLKRGAVGVCCQKVSEAEAMVVGGIGDVLITNEIVSREKLLRVAALACQADIGLCVDSALGIVRASEAAGAVGGTLRVLVEIDAGQHRCGVRPGEEAARLAKQVDAAPGLVFGGLQAYHGSAQQIRGAAERQAAIEGTIAAVAETREALAAAGLDCPTVTGAGSGSFPIEATSGAFTELQPGSYLFMDHSYVRNEPSDGAAPQFSPALFVLSAVMSAAVPGQVVLDAGSKSVSSDGGLPQLPGRPGLEVTRLADEHVSVRVEPGTEPPSLGDRLRLLPGHCDTTVGLHDWFVGCRDGRVEAVWPIAARGAVA